MCRDMSTLIQKLAKTTPSSLKLFRQPRWNPRLHPTPSPTLVPRQTILGSSRPERSRDSSRFLDMGIDETAKASQIFQLYPVFPFGFCADPNYISSPVLDGAEPVEGDDYRSMWADSVKKKRKRKMNKHKYKKLRKRLRRKTKS